MKAILFKKTSGMLSIKREQKIPGAAEIKTMILSKTMERMDEVLKETSNMIMREAKRLVNVMGKGIPSKPGKPPHRQTGTLWRGIKTSRLAQAKYRIGVDKKAYYARWLEEGTRDGRIKKRPFLRPALRKGVQFFKGVMQTSKKFGMEFEE